MTGRLDALIFDVDGTLAETEEVHRQAFNQAFAEFGLPWVWDVPLYRRLLTVAGGRERIRAFAGPQGLPVDLDILHRRKAQIYTARVAAGEVALRPGVAALLAEARAGGLRLAIATTTSRANVVALLDAVGGQADGFELLVCGEDVAAKKPDPAVYHQVLERMGLPAAACLAIEDSPNGIMAARAAGLEVVATPSLFTTGNDFTGALAVLDGLAGVGVENLRTLRR